MLTLTGGINDHRLQLAIKIVMITTVNMGKLGVTGIKRNDPNLPFATDILKLHSEVKAQWNCARDSSYCRLLFC
jgi:hypothetical protein